MCVAWKYDASVWPWNHNFEVQNIHIIPVNESLSAVAIRTAMTMNAYFTIN